MEHKIVFATSNAGKMREIREILKDLGAEILSMKVRNLGRKSLEEVLAKLKELGLQLNSSDEQ